MMLVAVVCSCAAAPVTGGLSKVSFVVNNYLASNVAIKSAELQSGTWDIAPMDTPRHGMVPPSYVGSEAPR